MSLPIWYVLKKSHSNLLKNLIKVSSILAQLLVTLVIPCVRVAPVLWMVSVSPALSHIKDKWLDHHQTSASAERDMKKSELHSVLIVIIHVIIVKIVMIQQTIQLKSVQPVT
jgi:hypothetical protein